MWYWIWCMKKFWGNGFGKKVIIFSADISLYVHSDNKKKDMLTIGKDPTNDD